MTALETWTAPKPVKLTIEDFIRLNDAGAFDAYAKTELIDGVVVAMNAQLSTHARVQSRFFRRLADAVEAVMPGYEAWVEVSTAIPPPTLPQPDRGVTRCEATGRAPGPVATIPLLVEVADTTKRYDLGKKARIYATAGVPEYWVIDIPGKVIHRLWAPAGGSYESKGQVAFDKTVHAATIQGLSVATSGL